MEQNETTKQGVNSRLAELPPENNTKNQRQNSQVQQVRIAFCFKRKKFPLSSAKNQIGDESNRTCLHL